MPTITITNFVDGLNTRDDQRRLMPLSDKDSTAEASAILNFDITSEGALLTSPGFTEVCDLEDDEGIINGWAYSPSLTTRYIVFAHKDKIHSLNTATNVASEIGSYGTQATQMTAVQAADYTDNGEIKLYIGNTTPGNKIKVFDGTTLTDLDASAPEEVTAMAVFMGRLFAAKGSTVFYTNTDDFADWAGGGSIKFNDIVTGFQVEGKRLIVFTRTYNQGIFFDYDDTFVISAPLKEEYERKFGALAPGAITRINSDVFYLGEDIKAYQLGAEVINDSTGLPRPRTISAKIDPSLQLINQENEFKVTTEYFNKQWLLGLPINSSEYNNVVFKWVEDFQSWSTGFGYYPSSFIKVKDENSRDQLYFTSAVEPKVFKFDNSYSFDGSDYIRRWKSKIFTMGAGGVYKLFKSIELAGSMYTSTTFYVKVTIDGRSKTYVVNQEQLQPGVGGNYIGDDNVGDAYIGGANPNESAFKRFRAYIDIGSVFREGFELQVEIYNSGAGQPVKVDELLIDYEYRSRNQKPAQYIVKETLPN